MQRSLDDLTGHRLAATDGEVGRCRDFLVDDRHWGVRYIVADTGTWLPGRRVLLSPAAVRSVDFDEHRLHLDLDRERIEQAPPLAAHAPVSHQYEREFALYYGYPFYWGGPAPWGVHPNPRAYAMAAAHERADATLGEEARHLRSLGEVRGYRIAAADDTLGKVDDLLFDAETWVVGLVVVKTGGWLKGRKVLLPPAALEAVSWTEGTFRTDLKADRIREAPPYEGGAVEPEIARRIERAYAT